MVKHASRTIVGILSESDSLAIVAFSEKTQKARVLLPLTKMTEINKIIANDKIECLEPRYSTNLYDDLHTAVLELIRGQQDSSALSNANVMLTGTHNPRDDSTGSAESSERSNTSTNSTTSHGHSRLWNQQRIQRRHERRQRRRNRWQQHPNDSQAPTDNNTQKAAPPNPLPHIHSSRTPPMEKEEEDEEEKVYSQSAKTTSRDSFPPPTRLETDDNDQQKGSNDEDTTNFHPPLETDSFSFPPTTPTTHTTRRAVSVLQSLRQSNHSYWRQPQDSGTVQCVQAALVRLLCTLCHRTQQNQPVILYWDNVHQADAASLQVIQALAKHVIWMDHRDDSNATAEDRRSTNNNDTNDSQQQVESPDDGSCSSMVLILSYCPDEIAPAAASSSRSDAQHQEREHHPFYTMIQSIRQEITTTTNSNNNNTTSPHPPTIVPDPTEPASGPILHELELNNFTLTDVTHLVSQVVNTDHRNTGSEDIRALAHLIYQNTAGNPWSVHQLLDWLQQEAKGLSSSSQDRTSSENKNNHNHDMLLDSLSDWLGSDHHVAQQVAHARFKWIPSAPTRTILMVAACLGKLIVVPVLVEWIQAIHIQTASNERGDCRNEEWWWSWQAKDLSDASSSMSSSPLQSLVQEVVSAPVLEEYLNVAVQGGVLTRPEGQETYMWAHEHLHAVAYSLIPTNHRPKLHFQLGRLLAKLSCVFCKPDPQRAAVPTMSAVGGHRTRSAIQREVEWMVFLAADQMNRGFAAMVVDNPDEPGTTRHEIESYPQLRVEVATLCLEAAKISLSKSALFPAHEILQAGVDHLKQFKEREDSNKKNTRDDSWTTHYELSLQLYSTVAEVSIQIGKREAAMEAVEQVESNARSFHDKFHVQVVRLRYITSGQDRNYPRGVEVASEILRGGYGVNIPSKLFPGQLLMETRRLRRQLPGGSLEGLLQLPFMTDYKCLQTMHILVTNLSFFALMATKDGSNLGWYAAVRALKLSVEKGVSEETALAIVCLASSYREQGLYKEANEYGEMGIELLERFPPTVGSIHALVVCIATASLFSSTKAYTKCLDFWLQGHHLGLRTGMTDKAGVAILGYTVTYIVCGLPLAPLRADLREYKTEVVQCNLPKTILAALKIKEQFILNLQHRSTRQQQGENRNPAVLKGSAMDEDELLKSFTESAYAMTKRDIYTFRLLLAIIYGDWKMAEMIVGVLEPFLYKDFLLVRAEMRRLLVALAAFCCSNQHNSQSKTLRSMGKKIMKTYKEHVKKGSINALPMYLMLAAVEDPSKERYENAIRICCKMGILHYAAIMCEQAAQYFRHVKDNEWADYYIREALSLYCDWGAEGKAYQLAQQHETLFAHELSLLHSGTKSDNQGCVFAVKGRTRYSASHFETLQDLDWNLLLESNLDSSASNSCSESPLTSDNSLPYSGSSPLFSVGGSSSRESFGLDDTVPSRTKDSES